MVQRNRRKLRWTISRPRKKEKKFIGSGPRVSPSMAAPSSTPSYAPTYRSASSPLFRFLSLSPHSSPLSLSLYLSIYLSLSIYLYIYISIFLSFSLPFYSIFYFLKVSLVSPETGLAMREFGPDDQVFNYCGSIINMRDRLVEKLISR